MIQHWFEVAEITSTHLFAIEVLAFFHETAIAHGLLSSSYSNGFYSKRACSNGSKVNGFNSFNKDTLQKLIRPLMLAVDRQDLIYSQLTTKFHIQIRSLQSSLEAPQAEWWRRFLQKILSDHHSVTVLSAQLQTAGIGRYGRSWLSNPPTSLQNFRYSSAGKGKADCSQENYAPLNNKVNDLTFNCYCWISQHNIKDDVIKNCAIKNIKTLRNVALSEVNTHSTLQITRQSIAGPKVCQYSWTPEYHAAVCNRLITIAFINAVRGFLASLPHHFHFKVSAPSIIKVSYLNDIFANGSKMVGCLTTHAIFGEQLLCSVGIGINVLPKITAAFPSPDKPTPYPIISLLELYPQLAKYPQGYLMNTLKRHLQKKLNCALSQMKAGKWRNIVVEFNKHLDLLHQKIVVYNHPTLAEVIATGYLQGVNTLGELVIVQDNEKGEIITLPFGTIRAA